MTTPRFDAAAMRWLLTPDDWSRLEADLGTARAVALDTETTGLHPRGGDGVPPALVMISLTLDAPGDPSWVIPLQHSESPWSGRWRSVARRVCTLLTDRGLAVAGHNLAFDLTWLEAHAGVDLSPLSRWDTMIASRLIDEDRSARLKDVAPRLFGVEAWDDFPLSKPGAALRVPLTDLGRYAVEDTHYTLMIWRWQRDHLFLPSSGQTPANRLEAGQERLGRLASVVAMPALRTLSRVQQYGIGIDTDWCRDGLADKGEEVERLTKELTDLYPVEGEPSFAPTSTWFLAWTEEAVRAGDLQVTATTSRGRPQWSKDVLRRQAQHGSQVAADLLELRTLVKHREYLTSWLALEAHGRLYPKFNIGRTVSGRLSSSDPNLQQVTRALKPAFVPAPGHLIAEVDLSQIELRIAAFISRDEAMMAAYREGRDLHRLTASRVLGMPEADVTPADRQKAKAVGFGFLYGMGAAKFRFYAEAMYGVTLTDEEAVEWRSRFFEGYPRLSEWHQWQMAEAHQTGQVVSPLGRVRQFDYVDERAERQAINAPVQGMASDIMLSACSIVAGFMPGCPAVPNARIVGTVHDSMVVEVPADGWEEPVQQVLETMTTGVLPVMRALGCTLDVPLAAEATVGSRWGLDDVATVAYDPAVL